MRTATTTSTPWPTRQRTRRVVVVCRPHNPTGTFEPAADIERFLRRVPPDTVVLLDEAYVEFLSPEYRIDAPALVERYPNVVVLRTFSKAYGLAGLRIGYGFCAPDLARRLWTMQPPFGIGITSLVAVAASYDAESQLRQRIRMIASERRYLRMRLRSMGVVQHRRPCQLRLPAAVAPAVAGGVRRHRDCRSATTPMAVCGSPLATGSRPALCWPPWRRSPYAENLPGVGRCMRYEEAWPRNRMSMIRSRWRAPTGSDPAGVTSPTAWSR